MPKNSTYTLVPCEVPSSKKESGVYKEMIADFKEAKEDSMLIETDKKIPTLLNGLRRVKDDSIVIVQRGKEVYLLKK
jgi:hypothetical protein